MLLSILRMEKWEVFALLQLLLLGNKFQRMAEYSESRPFPVRPVVDKLVTERVAALPAEDLQSWGLYSGRDVHQALVGLHLLGQGVGTDRVGESRPGCVVFVLLCAEEKTICYLPNLPRKILPREKRMITFAAHVHSRIEIVSMDLLFRPRTKRHFEMFCLKSIWELNILIFTRYLLNKTMTEHPLSRLPCILFNS